MPKAVEKTKKTKQPPLETLLDGNQDLTNSEQDFLVLRKRNVEISSDNEEVTYFRTDRTIKHNMYKVSVCAFLYRYIRNGSYCTSRKK